MDSIFCCDNYFSSVPLLEYLLINEVYCRGTIRSNRKNLPVDIKADKKLTSGEHDQRVLRQGLCFFKLMDSKAVNIISNFHGTEMATIQRTQKDGTKLTVNCPSTVRDYNKFMGGIDKADICCAIYGTSRKSMKWWHDILFWAYLIGL